MSSITEILKLKGDKKVLVPDDPWIAVEGGGTYNGYEYLIVLNTIGYRCGYVAIPPEHRYSQTPLEKRTFFGKEYDHYNYDDLDISCHYGLTFMAPDHGLKDLLTTPCNDMWIGFDCGHMGDAIDLEAVKEYFGEEKYESKKTFIEAMNCEPYSTVKSYEYAEKECHSIIDQLKAAA